MADGGVFQNHTCPACSTPDDAGHLLKVAMRKLSAARELADELAGRGSLEHAALVGRSISDLVLDAQRLMSRAHG